MTGSQAIHPPSTKRVVVLRLLGITWLAGTLFWLSIEDNNLTALISLSLVGSFLAGAIVYQTRRDTFQAKPLGWVLLGAAVGLGVTACAVLLVALKAGLHGHSSLDFTPEQILALLTRTVWWLLAGLIAGSGMALIQKASQ